MTSEEKYKLKSDALGRRLAALKEMYLGGVTETQYNLHLEFLQKEKQTEGDKLLQSAPKWFEKA